MARLLWAMGAMGHTGDAGQAGSEREIQRALQWLFWMLAIIAYGCVAVAIVAFVGSDGRRMDSISNRNYTAWLAVLGLATDRKEHTSELQSLMRISYAVFCLK